MPDNTTINPDEGTFVGELAVNGQWPPQSDKLFVPDLNLGDEGTLRVICRANATLEFHFRTSSNKEFSAFSCPLSFSGSGYFKFAFRYGTSGITVFASGLCIASNEPDQQVEDCAEIKLKDDDGPAEDHPTALEYLPPNTIGLFDSASAKIRRAKKHIADYDEAESAFWGRNPYIVVKEFDAEKAKYNRVVRIREHIPNDFALIIGDAVHNLRAALDLLATDLVRANGGSTKSVYFPFSNNGEDFDAMLERRNMGRAAPDVVDMLRALKPYHGGDELLRGLHDLDIADKHLLLIPVAGFASQPNMAIDFVRGVYIRRTDGHANKSVEDGTVLDSGIPANLEIDDDNRIFQITFANGQPFANDHVGETLKKIANLVDGITETFASHVLRGNN
tara:strand:- start:856 stop:2028 length:1173 start_codon:yes stop_codon:yes gene_type:complete